jgi:hypothetical protein
MKKIKYVLVIFIILLFTGCSGNYNLKFNKDLSVEEELNVIIENTDDNYERTYSIFEQSGIDSKKYEIAIVDEGIRIKYKEKYDSFDEYYLDSNLYKMFFKNIEFTKDETGMKINAKNILKLDDKGSQNIINSYDIDDLKINMIIPFSVNKTNADTKKNNTYTWKLNKNDTYKEINMNFSYEQDKIYGIVILSLIGLAVTVTLIYIGRYLLKNQRL